MKIRLVVPFLVFSLSSCKFYYNSADINKKLKISLDNVNSNCDKLSGQIRNYQSEFLKLNCTNSTLEQKKASSMFDEINISLVSLSTFRQKTNDEYGKFVLYTKGKDKIQSGTTEWKSFKDTKRQFKSALKSIQKRGNETVKNAEELNKFVLEQVTPKIQKCVVADYQKSIKLATDSLRKLEQDLPIKIAQYTTKVSLVLKNFESSFPAQCKELNSELSKMKELEKELNLIADKVQFINRDFLRRTKGIEYIYSCSSEWEFVLKTEQEMRNEQTKLNEIRMKLQLIQNQIQTIANQMKQ
jgi:hypothetical protein